MVELIKEKLSITKERSEIIHFLTIVPNNFTISKNVEVFNVSQYSVKQAGELHHKKGILSVPERNNKTTDYLHMKGVLDSIELQMLRRVDYLREHNILGESHVQSYVTPSVLMLGGFWAGR